MSISPSDLSVGNRQVIENWEPTYRMKPSENEKFVPRAVEAIIKDVMDKKLKKAKFDDAKCKLLALELCSEIKEKVKGTHKHTHTKTQSRIASEISNYNN